MSLKEFLNNLCKALNIALIGLLSFSCTGQQTENNKNKIIVKTITKQLPIIVGAEQLDEYLALIELKKVGIVANQTSVIHNTHLVDSLLSLNISIVKVFSPEHGFRGNADAGEKVSSSKDVKTGLPIVSLYGKNKKPTSKQLKGIEVMIFDIQDVGVRFYTYISTMHYVMEACAENNIPLIILDRPNPNGHYVDGPVLEKNFTSFIGMHPVPIVHGMTVGEYAKMINGEKWLKNGVTCNLTVVKVKNYTHNSFYQLPIKPSPNLPNMAAVYLYPSLCLFEGTPISIGRGTEKPFQIVGHPDIKSDRYNFTPKPTEGAKHPKLENKKCYGYDLSTFGKDYIKNIPMVNIDWIIDIYIKFPNKNDFFNESFDKLTGTHQLQQQIKEGVNEQAIYKSWQPKIKEFKKIRKRYLLYKDFE